MSEPYGGKVYVGNNARNVQSSPGGKVTQVILHIDENKAKVAVAEPNDGLTVEANCPWATQAMADAVLASLRDRDYEYRPYEAESALLEPAAELGDAITTSGFYSGIYRIAKKFGRLGAADLAAPQKSEEEHELQYKTASERRWTRTMKEISAEFAVLNDEISAKVDQTGGDNRSFGWSMTVDGMSWYANGSQVMKIDAQGLTVQGKIKAGSSIEAGSLTIAGTNITAANLRSGAQSAVDNGSTWTTGSGYGYDYNKATTEGSTSPSYFKANVVNAGTSFRLGGYRTTWANVTIDGTQYTFLKQGVYTG